MTDLIDSINERVKNVVESDHLTVLEVFDATNLVTIQCGFRSNGKIVREKGEGYFEDFGVRETKKLIKVISKMKDIK